MGCQSMENGLDHRSKWQRAAVLDGAYILRDNSRSTSVGRGQRWDSAMGPSIGYPGASASIRLGVP